MTIETRYPSTWNRLMINRAQKLEGLRAAGVDPFRQTKFVRTHLAADVSRVCSALENEAAWPKGLVVAGRIMAVRTFKKLAFIHLEDESGKLQVMLSVDRLGLAEFEKFTKFIEVGDYLGVRGDTFKTKTGEITLGADEFSVLAKALRPLPEKWKGLQDEEVRQRQRYLDLASSPAVRERFRQRSQVVWLMREYLHNNGFMEVETPILQELHGGAAARPFVTHHNALDMDLYLRIATELHLKRLIAGGYERVFEIGRIFRNEGIDRRHNPEFTSMEVYWAYADYEDMMRLTEQCVSSIASGIHGRSQVDYQSQLLDFTPPWKRMTMEEAVAQIGGVQTMGVSTDKLREIALQKGVPLEDSIGRGWIITTLFEELVEKQLTQPTFIYRYPVETTPLAKRSPDDPNYVDRFEAYVAGMELANAFSELNDPIDQRARFEEQAAELAGGNEEAQPFDEDFVQAIEIGMPPTGGLGIGIDRLAMVLTDSPSIRDVVLFPTMKRK
ncbi:MAG: lysine--tRNA ligase [Candidatus Margulisbacteria bacterium]|nr:lysine--tRNA ligase [Candidatus Margulisiibacteriota bacterium]MBU1617672.1 lysine--tRNA ligase [Candidatus Margulisiibacteriota bacterium]